MATSRFVYALQPLLNAAAARESVARQRHAQAAAALTAGVRELVALDRAAGRLAAALGWSSPSRAASTAWQAGEIDRRLARIDAVRSVRIAEIDAARERVAGARAELAPLVRRRKALERHRARRLERHRAALEAADEAEREEADSLQRGSPLEGCEVLSA